MTSVNLKDIAQKALVMVIVSELSLIVVSFFAYAIVPAEWLDMTIMPLMVCITSPILFVVTIIITWIYRNYVIWKENYVIWKEIRDEHQRKKSATIENGIIHYPDGSFERQMK